METFSILLISLLFALLIRKQLKNKSHPTPKKLPPGPPKLPIIGNLHQFLLHPLPHHRLRDLSTQYGPLMHLQIGQLSTFVISSPEVAKQLTKTHDVNISKRPFNFLINIICQNNSHVTDLIFCPYGDHWRQLRKICTMELLSAKRVQSFRSIREEQVSELVNWIGSQNEINLTEKIYSLSNAVIFRTMVGKRHRDHAILTRIVQKALDEAGGFNVGESFPWLDGLVGRMSGVKSRVKKWRKEKDRIFDDIIDQHRRREKIEGEVEDFVDVLLKVQEDANAGVRLTTEVIKAVLMDMFIGGIDTSANTLDWAMAELMKNPKIMKKTQNEVREVFHRIGKTDESGISEMTMLKAVVKETLRLHPPFPLMPRECYEKCRVNGFEIPAKANIITNAWAIGRNPNYWKEPNEFIPERFIDTSLDYKGTNFEYLPFGSGRRSCPGMLFGIANVEFPLAKFLYHFDWKLPNNMESEDLDMTETFGLAVRRKKELHLIPIPYHP